MRRLLWFTLGFGAACAVGTYLAPGLLLLAAAAAAGLASAFLLALGRGRKGLRRCAALLLGLCIGMVWFFTFDSIRLRPARNADGQVSAVTLRVTRDPRPTSYGWQVQGELELEGRSFSALLYSSGDASPRPGDLVTAEAELRLTTDGGSREPTFHRSNGIFLLAYTRGPITITPGEPGWQALPLMLGRWVRRAIHDHFPADTAGFAQALVLGDTSELTYAQRNQFSLVGISHIAAVSGMHLSILFALVYALTLRRRFLSALVGIPVLFLFAGMAGFSPSALRAAMMLSLSLLARVINKEYDSPTALAFAVLVLLVINPIAAGSVSLQMSVGAVSGILCFTKPLQAWLQGRLRPNHRFAARLWKTISGALAVTLGASVFTLPIIAVTFGAVSLIAPLANLLCLWAVSLIFYGVLAICVLDLVWAWAAGLLALVISWPVRYVLMVARLLSRFPLAAVYPGHSPYILGWLVFAALLLGAFCLIRFRAKGWFAFGLVLGLALAIGCSWLEPLTEHFRVTVLDVGQGQCILLQAEGRTFVVDCGGSDGEAVGETAARYLQSMGVFQIDGLILTHTDTDHTSGVRQLTGRIPTERLILPPIPPRSAFAVPDGIPVTTPAEDLILRAGDMTLTVFAPLSRTTSNQSGLSVLFTWKEYDTLITGDMDRSMERRLVDLRQLPDLELLAAGHHGSANATSPQLLEATHPEILLISVGRNHYGHPAAETLARAAEYGAQVWRTDLRGTIIIRG